MIRLSTPSRSVRWAVVTNPRRTVGVVRQLSHGTRYGKCNSNRTCHPTSCRLRNQRDGLDFPVPAGRRVHVGPSKNIHRRRQWTLSILSCCRLWEICRVRPSKKTRFGRKRPRLLKVLKTQSRNRPAAGLSLPTRDDMLDLRRQSSHREWCPPPLLPPPPPLPPLCWINPGLHRDEPHRKVRFNNQVWEDHRNGSKHHKQWQHKQQEVKGRIHSHR